MSNRLKDVAPDAGEKQQKRFKTWLSGNWIEFESHKAREKYRKRVTLLIDAIELKKPPERVPVCPSPGHFPLEYANVSFYDAMYNHDALEKAWRKYYEDFTPDTYSSSMIGPGRVLEMLDNKLYNWAGHGVPKNREYQFVEKEYMSHDEYEELINDPSWFHLTRFLPRIYGVLKPLEHFPQLVHLRHMSSMAPGAMYFDLPDVQEMCRLLSEAAAESNRWLTANKNMGLSIMSKGLPSMGGGIAEAPFDMVGDNLRGTKGVLMDMLKRPDLLLEACEKYVLPTVQRATAASNITANPLIFMPLHKGADPFMSNDQFKTFYWPTLRKVLIGMINEGLVPVLFAESKYDSRLEIISDLPRGKVIWWFESVDMARAKETVGQGACIAGNVPNILFKTATSNDMKEICKQLIDVAGKNGGYIISTAAGLQGAKPENVKTFIDFSKEYGVYS